VKKPQSVPVVLILCICRVRLFDQKTISSFSVILFINYEEISHAMSHATWPFELKIAGRRPRMSLRVLSPPLRKTSLSRHRESDWSRIGDKLCEIVECWPFLQSESVNNVCKLFLFQRLRCPDPLTGLRPSTLLGDFCPPYLWAISTPKWKFLGPPLHKGHIHEVGNL